MPEFDPKPVVLEGRHIRLEPLRDEHIPELWRAADDDEIWAYRGQRPRREAEYAELLRETLTGPAWGKQVAWVTRRKADGLVLGSTRYFRISPPNRSLEIGWTSLSREGRRTAANTEAKSLQLRHAFETLGAIRVSFGVDERNARSRAAVERIGATFEGVLRRDTVLRDGYVRSSVIYGITDADWPSVKRRLERLMAR